MGSINARHIHQISPGLLEGKIYLFNDFEVWRAGDQYKISDHLFLIRLNPNSKITPVQEKSVIINCEIFKFRDYDQFMEIADKNLSYDGNKFICIFIYLKVTTNQFITFIQHTDIIGVIVEEKLNRDTTGTEQKRINLDMQLEGYVNT